MQRPERVAWFRLARALHMSVRRAQEEIDAREFVEWMNVDTAPRRSPEAIEAGMDIWARKYNARMKPHG